MKATPSAPHHAEALTRQLALWSGYLRHDDKAARLVGLRAIQEYTEALIAQEYCLPPQHTTPGPGPGRMFTRLMTRIRSLA